MHIESGTLKLHHILTINRMMYHHYIRTLDENETVRKMYNNQKEKLSKGDCYDLVCNDFEFIGKNLNKKK